VQGFHTMTVGVAWKTADQFGRRSGYGGARTATFEHGYRALTADMHPGSPAKARALGRVRVPSRFATRHPDQFAGMLCIWRERRLV
jgi:hypothetical protein